MVKIYIPEKWRNLKQEKLIPLASFLLKEKKTYTPNTWRDKFCHNMDFKNSCTLVNTIKKSNNSLAKKLQLLVSVCWQQIIRRRISNRCVGDHNIRAI